MHFQLTKYKIFLGKGALPPCKPPPGAGHPPGPPYHFLIVSRCLDALSGFEEYQFHHVHWAYNTVISMHRGILKKEKCIPQCIYYALFSIL